MVKRAAFEKRAFFRTQGFKSSLLRPVPVAQWIRASVSGTGGRRFESSQGHMAKEKKPVKREVSAGGAVFKEEKGKVLWLIVQPQRDDLKKPIHWRLAKGIIEKNESTEAAALREVEEETGVKTEVMAKIGKTTYFYNFKGQKIFKIIIFFLMQFQTDTGNEIDGVEIKERLWLPYAEAYEKLTFDSEKEILKKAKELLKEKKKQLKLI